MSGVKTKLAERGAESTPFRPTAQLPRGDVQAAIEKLEAIVAAGLAAALENVVEDLSPQLGGNLDLNGHNITGEGNIDIEGTLVTTGDATIGDDLLVNDGLSVEGDSVLQGTFTVHGLASGMAGARITGGALATQFAAKGIYLGTETNGNEQFNIISTGTYGYFDIGGINEDYKLRFLVEIANGNTQLDLAGTLAFTTGGAVSFDKDVSVPDEAYDATAWNGSLEVPTKNAIRDKLAALTSGDITDFEEAVEDFVGGLFIDSSELDFDYNDGSNTLSASLIAGSVALTKLANQAALSVLANATNGSAGPTAVAAASDHQVFRRSGTALAFGAVNLAEAAAITGQLLSTSFPALTGAVVSAGGTLATTSSIAICFEIGDGVSPPTTGVKGDLRIPFACTLTGWTLLADQSGACKIDVWKDTYANFPPDNSDSITNAHEPEISASGSKAEDTNIADWSDVTVDAGDVLRINLDSVTSHTRILLVLHATKTS